MKEQTSRFQYEVPYEVEQGWRSELPSWTGMAVSSLLLTRARYYSIPRSNGLVGIVLGVSFSKKPPLRKVWRLFNRNE